MQPTLGLTRFESPLSPAWETESLSSFSASERARLARIKLVQRRAQFIVGHSLLRRLLSHAGMSDAAIDVAADGRALVRARVPLFASIAHSADAVVVIVAGVAVGVDIESSHVLRDPRAASAMLGLAAGETADTASVLRVWVATEAGFKAGPSASSKTWRSTWAGCQLAVAGIANPPIAGVVDAITGIYNATELQWQAV